MADCNNEFGIASYRGIEFEIMPSDHSGGRRIVTHLYPFSDEHYNEDLGDNPLEWSISGLFIGEDWRDRLTEAKARWIKTGAGEFFEPTENKQFLCTLKDFSFSLDSKRLNGVEFTLNLVEKGVEPYPVNSFSRYQSLQALQKYRSKVEEWYVNFSLGIVDLSPAFAAYNATIGPLRRIGLQFLRIGSFFKTIGVIDKAKPNRNPKISHDNIDAVFSEAIENDAPIGFYKAASEIRTAPPVTSEVQGVMVALVALGYYAERGQDGITFSELRDFRERALALKLAVNDTAVSSQIDNLIMSLGSSTEQMCELQGSWHALVASYHLYGDISRANEIVGLSIGVSGADIGRVVHRCAE